MITEKLLLAVTEKFPDRKWSQTGDDDPVIRFAPECDEVGEVRVYDADEGAIVEIEKFTRLRFGCSEKSLSEEEKIDRIIKDVAEFLSALFSDQVLLSRSRNRRIVESRRLDRPDRKPKLRRWMEYFVWSGPFQPDGEKGRGPERCERGPARESSPGTDHRLHPRFPEAENGPVSRERRDSAPRPRKGHPQSCREDRDGSEEIRLLTLDKDREDGLRGWFVSPYLWFAIPGAAIALDFPLASIWFAWMAELFTAPFNIEGSSDPAAPPLELISIPIQILVRLFSLLAGLLGMALWSLPLLIAWRRWANAAERPTRYRVWTSLAGLMILVRLLFFLGSGGSASDNLAYDESGHFNLGFGGREFEVLALLLWTANIVAIPQRSRRGSGNARSNREQSPTP